MILCNVERNTQLELEEFRTLAELVRRRTEGVAVDYYPSPGNWGDALINAGTTKFLDYFGIEVQTRGRQHLESLDADSKGWRAAIVGGGGGWNHNWNSTVEFVRRAAGLYRDVVVLPSSYDPELVESIPRDNTVLVARGQGKSLQCADLFCHDMAFAVEVTESSRSLLPYPLIAFRRDKERSSLSISPDRNWDLSLLGDSFTEIGSLLRIVGRFSEVWTDRLHIGIAGALMGARVHLLEGNYGKVEEVFGASIRHRFANVTFHEWVDVDWSSVTGISPIGVSGYPEGGAQ